MHAFINIQTEDFDQAEHYSALAQGKDTGAIVTFVGRVREFCGSGQQQMWLEHYAGMTEKVLHTRIELANERWPLQAVRIVHRIGHLQAGEQIVFVGVSATHRKNAFHACEYLMDYLKTEAPFWKREGKHWVEAKSSDTDAAQNWDDND